MCAKAPPDLEDVGIMSLGTQQNPFAQAQGLDLHNQMVANPFDGLVYPKAQTIPPPPTKTIGITVDQVSNGYIVKVRQQGAAIDRIVSDFENLGLEIMAALAEIQLGK